MSAGVCLFLVISYVIIHKVTISIKWQSGEKLFVQ